ncbi:hypothetical protein F2Q69_00034068 [Brassica cretica]|uniref:Uncharacterized protein n=1 Tax=Brassica cretica TaxID=69181 RepID=A0A8S9SMB2_BRACR|nr:hypothetical protein F2Q69_00034068 [Brassica cretica]
MNTKSPGPRYRTRLGVYLVSVGLTLACTGCKALCLDAVGRVSGRTGRGRGVKFVTLAGSSLTCHVALPDHGVGLDGQSCSCLIVGWPVGLSSPTLGVGCPSVMDENLKVEGVRGQTQTRCERGETNTENWAVVWTGHMVRNKTLLGKDFISIWGKGDREGFEESGQVRIMGNQSIMAEQQ